MSLQNALCFDREQLGHTSSMDTIDVAIRNHCQHQNSITFPLLPTVIQYNMNTFRTAKNIFVNRSFFLLFGRIEGLLWTFLVDGTVAEQNRSFVAFSLFFLFSFFLPSLPTNFNGQVGRLNDYCVLRRYRRAPYFTTYKAHSPFFFLSLSLDPFFLCRQGRRPIASSFYLESELCKKEKGKLLCYCCPSYSPPFYLVVSTV